MDFRCRIQLLHNGVYHKFENQMWIYNCDHFYPSSILLQLLWVSQNPRNSGKVVLFAALLNLFGDFFLCAWPFHFGIMGAAAATALSTLMGFQMMWQALKRTGWVWHWVMRSLLEDGVASEDLLPNSWWIDWLNMDFAFGMLPLANAHACWDGNFGQEL